MQLLLFYFNFLKVRIYEKKFNFSYYHIWRENLGEKKPQKKQKTLNTDQFSVCDLISKVLPPPTSSSTFVRSMEVLLLMGGLKIILGQKPYYYHPKTG